MATDRANSDRSKPRIDMSGLSPDDKLKLTRNLHGKILPGAIYSEALNGRILPAEDTERSMDYAADAIKRMGPRDPAEEMLIAQMLLAHGRVLHLSQLANQQTDVETIQVTHEYADRASNTYRRLMLALAEYRRPAPVPAVPTVQQTNIAAQQIIQTNAAPTNCPPAANENATNEQGFGAGSRPGAAVLPALPADTGRLDFVEELRAARQAVEPIHRAADARRQGPVAAQRHEAR